MIKLDKTKVYDLSELTSEQWNILIPILKKQSYYGYNYQNLDYYKEDNNNITLYFNKDECWVVTSLEKPTTNAKELFYTLENVQVDCRGLNKEQIKEMADIYHYKGYLVDDDGLDLIHEATFLNFCFDSCSVYFKMDDKTTITYDKFTELFGNKEKSEEFNNLVEVLNEELEESRNEDYYYVFSDDSKELFKANSIGEGVNIRLELTPEGVVKFLADKDVFLSPEDYKKLFE